MNIDFTRTITATDRARQARAARRQDARDLLARTDWALLRQFETGEPVPGDIRRERARARRVLAEEGAGERS